MLVFVSKKKQVLNGCKNNTILIHCLCKIKL